LLFAMQLPLVATSKPSLLPLRVSNVYQQFSDPEEGSVQNIIDFSIWPLLQVLTFFLTPRSYATTVAHLQYHCCLSTACHLLVTISPMQDGNGARARVEAKYEIRSSRRIALTFQAAGVSARPFGLPNGFTCSAVRFVDVRLIAYTQAM